MRKDYRARCLQKEERLADETGMDRNAATRRGWMIISIVLGTPAWLAQFSSWTTQRWSVADVGVWWTAWRLILSGRGSEMFKVEPYQIEFFERGLRAHAPFNIWVFPPQHAVLFAPLGLLNIRVLFVLILALNAGLWWWMLRDIASVGGTYGGSFWSPTRRSVFRSVGWMFVPAAISGHNAAFSCLVAAGLWFVLKSTILSSEIRPSIKGEWCAAVVLFLAMIKPQMVLFTVVGLLASSGFGRAVATKAIALVVASSAAVAAAFGPAVFLDWFDVLKSLNAGRMGSPAYVRWSPLPILASRYVEGPLPVWGSVSAVGFALALAAWAWSSKRISTDRSTDRSKDRATDRSTDGSTATHHDAATHHAAQHRDRAMAATVVSLTLTYLLATYQTHYDTIVIIPALGLGLILHSRRAGEQRRAIHISTVWLARICVLAAVPVSGVLMIAQAPVLAALTLSTLCVVSLFAASDPADWMFRKRALTSV
jgi:hypothetical protein